MKKKKKIPIKLKFFGVFILFDCLVKYCVCDIRMEVTIELTMTQKKKKKKFHASQIKNKQKQMYDITSLKI